MSPRPVLAGLALGVVLTSAARADTIVDYAVPVLTLPHPVVGLSKDRPLGKWTFALTLLPGFVLETQPYSRYLSSTEFRVGADANQSTQAGLDTTTTQGGLNVSIGREVDDELWAVFQLGVRKRVEHGRLAGTESLEEALTDENYDRFNFATSVSLDTIRELAGARLQLSGGLGMHYSNVERALVFSRIRDAGTTAVSAQMISSTLTYDSVGLTLPLGGRVVFGEAGALAVATSVKLQPMWFVRRNTEQELARAVGCGESCTSAEATLPTAAAPLLLGVELLTDFQVGAGVYAQYTRYFGTSSERRASVMQEVDIEHPASAWTVFATISAGR